MVKLLPLKITFQLVEDKGTHCEAQQPQEAQVIPTKEKLLEFLSELDNQITLLNGEKKK